MPLSDAFQAHSPLSPSTGLAYIHRYIDRSFLVSKPLPLHAMASISKPLPILALACLLLLVALVDAQVAPDDPSLLVTGSSMSRLLEAPMLDCPSTCLVRCGNNWKKKMCNKMCNVCCGKCRCVPPGTGQDTRHLCPCYDNMINPHTGKLKCP